MRRLAGKWLRLLQTYLPIPLFIFLLFPAAALFAGRQLLIGNGNLGRLWQLADLARRSNTPWRRFSLWRIWIAQIAMFMARQTRYWPDKLREPRWSRRCQFIGLEKLQAALASGRPVVLTTLHYGELTELYHWLRSRGIGVAFLTTRNVEPEQAYFNQFDLLANHANGLDGVPAFIGVGHLRLWEAQEFLGQPNRVLVVAMEGLTRRDLFVEGPGYKLRMAPGALHLAARAQATVMPCLIKSQFLKPTIRFGESLPQDVVAHSDRHHLGCEHVLRELGPWISAEPEQAGRHLISALRFPRES